LSDGDRIRFELRVQNSVSVTQFGLRPSIPENIHPSVVRRFGVPRLPQDCLRTHAGCVVASIEVEIEEDFFGIATREQVRERRARPCFGLPDPPGNVRRAGTHGWQVSGQTYLGYPESTKTECGGKSGIELCLGRLHQEAETESIATAHPVNGFEWTSVFSFCNTSKHNALSCTDGEGI
jgi:hypothetical protein